MTILIIMTLMSVALGLLIPMRWGVFGFLGAAAFLFALQVAINSATGFEGTSIEDSLLLFNGSYSAFIGFNVQITYRAFALPLLALAVPLVFRLRPRTT